MIMGFNYNSPHSGIVGDSNPRGYVCGCVYCKPDHKAIKKKNYNSPHGINKYLFSPR